MSFYLLSTGIKELIYAAKISTFLPNPLPTEKVPRISNPKPRPEYLNLSISAFFTKLTAPISSCFKQLPTNFVLVPI